MIAPFLCLFSHLMGFLQNPSFYEECSFSTMLLLFNDETLGITSLLLVGVILWLVGACAS